MLEIKDIVNVVINRETTTTTTRDLRTIAILSKHTNFDSDEMYREYSSTTAMLEDGFLTSDFAYIAVQRILSQNPQVRSVLVGKVDSSDNVDYVDAISKLQAANDAWFFLITDAEDDQDKEAIADYIENQTAVYVFSDSNTDTLSSSNSTDIFSKLQSKGLMKSFGMHVKNTSVVAPEAAWVGRFAASTIGSNTWIHKPLTTLSPESFSRTEMSTLRAKNAHFYTLVGQDPSIEGNANVVGGEKIHVILGVIWLEVRLSERMWSVLYTKDRLNFTNASVELFKAELVTVLNEAVSLNILTDADGFSIQVPDTNRLTSRERASGILRKLTFRARLAGAILFVDAIEGTVYT